MMIYCVEDDQSIRELMLYVLRASGFEAEGFPDGRSMLAALQNAPPKLILLDIMLPGMDGVELLKLLRASHSTASIPVIMASARGTEYDKVTVLDLGADDYLVKPFGMMEMVSRIRAVLRRTGGDFHNLLKVGDLTLDHSAHTVFVRDRQVSLTLKEYEILKLLLKNPGQVFSRELLLERIWGIDFLGESRTVDVHIGTLRTKLDPCGDYIRTVRGVGYRLENPA